VLNATARLPTGPCRRWGCRHSTLFFGRPSNARSRVHQTADRGRPARVMQIATEFSRGRKLIVASSQQTRLGWRRRSKSARQLNWDSFIYDWPIDAEYGRHKVVVNAVFLVISGH